jgi:hypothetical protein
LDANHEAGAVIGIYKREGIIELETWKLVSSSDFSPRGTKSIGSPKSWHSVKFSARFENLTSQRSLKQNLKAKGGERLKVLPLWGSSL